jgi:hypothetical protein
VKAQTGNGSQVPIFFVVEAVVNVVPATLVVLVVVVVKFFVG